MLEATGRGARDGATGVRPGTGSSRSGRRVPAPPDRSLTKQVPTLLLSPTPPTPPLSQTTMISYPRSLSTAVRGSLRERRPDPLRPGRASSARGGPVGGLHSGNLHLFAELLVDNRGRAVLGEGAFTAARSKASGPNVGMTSGASRRQSAHQTGRSLARRPQAGRQPRTTRLGAYAVPRSTPDTGRRAGRSMIATGSRLQRSLGGRARDNTAGGNDARARPPHSAADEPRAGRDHRPARSSTCTGSTMGQRTRPAA